jgi:DNA transformation protein and related proteins
MPVSADYQAYVIDQLAGLARVRSRRMFGGVGLYANDVFFGLIDDDTLYFKVDDSNRGDYVARGSAAFRPFPDEPTYSMSYFQVPAEILEEPEVLVQWARKAVAARGSGATRKKAAARRPRASKSRGTRSGARTARRK